MNAPIRVLYVDDNPLDRELVRDALEKEHGGFQVTEAKSQQDFEKRLSEGEYDLVLSDFNILGFEGLQVIDIIHAEKPSLPVVIVTGTGSEEVAVEALKRGAADYVIKTTHHIQRLPYAIHDLLEKKELAEKTKRAEEERDRLFNYSIDLLCVAGLDGYLKQINPAWTKTLGWSEAELLSRPYIEFIHPDDQEATIHVIEQANRGDAILSFESRHRCNNGSYKWISWNAYPLPDDAVVFAVARDVTEKKQAEEEIRRLNARLERRVYERTAQLHAANKELETFSYSVSHDLRSPLRHIDGYSSLLLEEAAAQNNPKIQEYIHTIRKASLYMGQLIDALLGLSRLERTEFQRVAFNISELAGAILTELQQNETRRAITCTIQDDLIVYASPILLRIALENLLGNAWKFTSKCEQAHIEFGCTAGDERVFFVRDNGVGFDMAYANKLFGVFQRLHNEKEFPGLGIGLATAQRVIHRHGGRIWAESAPSEGATFYFTLP